MRCSLIVLLLLAGPVLAEDRTVFFEKKVRPLLAEHCFACHSEKTNKRRGGLALDSAVALGRGGDNGPAVVAGKPDESLLLRAVRYEHATIHMPPNKRLSPADVAVLAEWVRQGAFFPGPTQTATKKSTDLTAARNFWSLRPLQRTPAPASSWSRRPIDAFLHTTLTQRRLTPAAEADRRTLIRRLTFDLTGLPPTPADVDAFVADARPDAYARLVERLLASPRYGERWARFWLDLVRYRDVGEQWADTKGAAFHYRDWVVRVLNADLPYPEFILRQLAADLILGLDVSERAALGLLGLSPVYWKELKLDHKTIEGVVAEEWEERIHTLSSTFLGLTVACARCHDHKFDPVSVQDYYALAGVLASVRIADVSLSSDPQRPVFTPGVVESSLHVLPDGPHKTKLTYRTEPRSLQVQIRGNPAQLGAVVPRRFLTVLSSDPANSFQQGSGRLDLARALVEDGQALTARVIVNRVWMHHFGQGLVRTPSDFGTQGERPTHPELLDNLAARFVEAGWSLKWLHREIVLSAAYRQSSSTHDRSAVAADPDARWLSRFPRRRLEVEAWRDILLAVTGELEQRVGGASLDLNLPTNQRRTLYGTVKRRELNDLLRLHDFPDPMTHSPARTPTITPLQQLFTLNSPFLRDRAATLVRRLHAEHKTEEERIRQAYRTLYGREPNANERRLGLEFLASGAGWPAYARVLLGSNELAFLE